MPTATAETLVCQNCGAPLKLTAGQTLVLCAYCYASNRIDFSADVPTRVSAAGALPADASSAIKKLLAEGKRDEAVQRYQDELHCERKDAEQAVQSVFEWSVFMAVLARQRLTPGGIVFGTLCMAVAVASIALLVVHAVPYVLGLPLLGVALLFCPIRRLWATLKTLGGDRGTATVKKLVWVGEMTAASRTNYCARVWVEVRPSHGPQYSASMDIVTRSKATLFESKQFIVKALHGDASAVVLAGPL